MNRKKGSLAKQNLDSELLNHIRNLELETIDEYRQWCEDNGFQNKPQKTNQQRQAEKSHYIQTGTMAHRNQLEKQNFVDQLSAVCSESLDGTGIKDPLLKRIWELYQFCRRGIDRSDLIRNSFLEMIAHLHFCQAEFFDDNPAFPEMGNYPGNRYLEALVLIAGETQVWVRPIEEWQPDTSSARGQFASLLRHLFVEYQMPLFFDKVWLMNYPCESGAWRSWYLFVGRGHNIRHCQLPIPFTKKMAHHLMLAPHDLTFQQAIRWGQIMGMKGDEELARAILATRLAEDFSNNDFWSTVIYWFCNHPSLDLVHVGPIIDYLFFQRFGFDTGDGIHFPLLRDFSMKGRTPRSLLRKVEEWHRALVENNRIPFYEWNSSGISGFKFLEGSQEDQCWKRWTIRELLTSHDLVAESRHMKHCVATYAHSCLHGHSSIWTMEVETAEGINKAVTIELEMNLKLICQVRGKANRMPNEKEQSILERWAKMAGLKISSAF